MAMKHVPLSRSDGLARPRLVRVLPAEDRGDGGDPVGGDPAARAARRRISSPSPTGPAARRAPAPTRRSSRSRARRYQAGGASDLRRRLARRDRRDVAPIGTPASATSWRCAAIRRAASMRPMTRTPTAISDRRSRRRDKGIGDFEVSVGDLSREASAKPDAAARHRRTEAQGRRRRGPGDHPVFLRQLRYFRFLDVAARGGSHDPDRAGHRAGAEFQTDRRFRPPRRRQRAGWLADRFEGLEDDLATRRLVAAAVCAEQVIDLIDRGVEELHFYTMNRADLVFAICHLIGFRAKTKAAAEAA